MKSYNFLSGISREWLANDYSNKYLSWASGKHAEINTLKYRIFRTKISKICRSSRLFYNLRRFY
jgi:hypothetical protein